MRILVSGATGTVGQHLVSRLELDGHSVITLTRHPEGPHQLGWDPQEGELDAGRLEGYDAVVHLAGDPIQKGRWTSEKKQRILESRVKGTSLLADRLASLNEKPRVLVCASGANYYPSDPDHEPWDESGPKGDSFLADVCAKWEAAADPARRAGIRVVHTRLAAVLSSEGGVLPTLMPIFRKGLGGPVGDGNQRFSWIHGDDAAKAMYLAISDDHLEGPVNLCSPEPCTFKEFTQALGDALDRPVRVRVPATVARIAMGEMADELVLADMALNPRKLHEAGFLWDFPELDGALQDLVARM